jgi:hypothetical protein
VGSIPTSSSKGRRWSAAVFEALRLGLAGVSPVLVPALSRYRRAPVTREDVEQSGQLLVKRWEQVPVAVERRSDRRMPKALLDGLRMRPGCDVRLRLSVGWCWRR